MSTEYAKLCLMLLAHLFTLLVVESFANAGGSATLE